MKRFWFPILAVAVALVPGVLSQNEDSTAPDAERQPQPVNGLSFVSRGTPPVGMPAIVTDPWTTHLQAAPVGAGGLAISVSDVPVMSAARGELLSLPRADEQRPGPDRPRDYAILPPAPEFESPRETRRRLPEPKAVHGLAAVRSATLSPVRVV